MDSLETSIVILIQTEPKDTENLIWEKLLSTRMCCGIVRSQANLILTQSFRHNIASVIKVLTLLTSELYPYDIDLQFLEHG